MTPDDVKRASELLDRRERLLEFVKMFQHNPRLNENSGFFFDGFAALTVHDMWKRVLFDRDHFSQRVCSKVIDILAEDVHSVEEEIRKMGVEL